MEDDGLPAADVGRWAEEKYRRVGMYSEIFSTGMKDSWDTRVYIDLLAGPGHAIVRETGQRVLTSPLLAIDVRDRFDQYIFCDRDPTLLDALVQRARRMADGVRVSSFAGDVNVNAGKIAAAIPAHTRGATVLSCCFVDPFDIGVHFETIRTLATGRAIDFLIVLMLHMDTNRNRSTYVEDDNPRIDAFLGDSSWRSRWAQADARGTSFVRFLAEEYSAAMGRLGYVAPGLERMVEVRMPEKNVPLYYLAFFSRHERGYKYWDEVRRYSTDQLSLLG